MLWIYVDTTAAVVISMYLIILPSGLGLHSKRHKTLLCETLNLGLPTLVYLFDFGPPDHVNI